MKKIYLSLASLVLVGAAFGQAGAPEIKKYPGLSADQVHKPTRAPQANSRSVAQPFNGWFDPVADPAYNKSLEFSGSNADITYYTNAIFPDSTVVVSDAAGSYQLDLFSMGAILDPTSSYLYADANGDPSGGSEGPVVTKNDSYNVDSVLIDAWYIKKKINVTDTLYVWVSWQQPNNNDVFVKARTVNFWNPPISDWRDSLLSIYMDTLDVNQTTGNVIKPKALSSNILLTKYVLTNDDTAAIVNGGRNVKRIAVKLDSVVNVPAGAITACYFAYIPEAGSYAAGDCIYQYSNPTKPQNANGFALRLWAQSDKDPALLDHLVDPSSKYSGALMFPKNDRYPALQNPPRKKYFLRGYLHYGPAVNFHIFGTSTVGINEVSANGNFSLGQNVPNPFTNETTISYQLKTNAKNVSLVVYNVAGVKVFEQAQTSVSAGKYSVNVNASNFAPGAYFYSLIVDGSQVTKKMVITE